MKKLLTFFAATLFASSAFSATNLANITGYNIIGSYPTGARALEYYYSGNTSSNAWGGNLVNNTGGTGTLADGVIRTAGIGHFILGYNTSGFEASITLFLDDDYYIDDVSFFTALDESSSLESATVNGIAITSTPFGQLVFGRPQPQDDLFDLSGTTLENTAINQITLSNFGFKAYTPKTFTLSEIQVTGTLVSAVPEPSTYALMLGGLGLIGFMAARRRRHLV